jgi:L-2-hydroxyglutarate oxidase LhgO
VSDPQTTPAPDAAQDPPGSWDTETFDVAVVGAGIVGLAVARELLTRRPGLSLAIIDRESSVGRHQTSHNSGVIHSGVYYRPGSLKARLCVEGSLLMHRFCEMHGIPFERCGKLIIALDESELAALERIERNGRANGVPGLRRIGSAQLAEVEPGCQGIAALHCPNTAITDFGEVARAMERELRGNGVSFRLGHRARRLERGSGGVTAVVTDRGVIRARFVIGCAGLWSDRLAVASGAPGDPRIVAFRGAYLTLRPGGKPVVRTLVYPVPDPALPFLGVHVTRRVTGEVTLGPTAMMAGARDGYRLSRLRARDVWQTATWPGTWRMGRRFWRTGVDELRLAADRRRFQDRAARYVPALADIPVQPRAEAGVRAQAIGRDGVLIDDFVISETPGALHVRNAPSPAATSALALAREIADRALASPQWPRPRRVGRTERARAGQAPGEGL